MKNILLNILIIGLFLGVVGRVLAYDLTLTKIGTLSTIGADYSLVSYVGTVPGLEGTATPAAMVSVKVNSTSNAVLAATTSGIWNFTPTSLSTGDNLITITSGSQSIIFTIRYSATTTTPTSTPSSSITTLPESGAWENVVLGMMFGVGIWFLGRFLKKKMHKWEGR